MRLRAAAALLLPMVLLAGCGGREPGRAELVVSAAASLGDVVRDAAERFQRRHPGVVVRTNLAASGLLEQQIRRGAGVDVFLSAGRREMDSLEADGLLRPGSTRVLARNRLALVVPAGDGWSPRGFRDLADPRVRRVALGAPESVPAGEYARTALGSLGLWDQVEPRAIYTANVRQALAYAERGEVDAALVYVTDARRSPRVRVAEVAPAAAHPPIQYPAAVVARSASSMAERFLQFLAGPEGRALFRRHGFSDPASAGGAS